MITTIVTTAVGTEILIRSK